MPGSDDFDKAVEETKRERSTADQPDETSADQDRDKKPDRDRKREGGPEQSSVPPGSSGDEDDYQSGDDR